MFFLIFGLWLMELHVFDPKFGVLLKNYTFCQLEMCSIPKFGQRMVEYIT